eukprot:TRINITY_DN26386_c0_g1_i1.p1 TRINITY_DN26386_c0_g1~~TRINITY_DN26386_c0_g1_i1.p1  ORF type:complete len:221 (+),score=56.56 TRINITY_DN26386_c0_g1_i1:57-719(+)
MSASRTASAAAAVALALRRQGAASLLARGGRAPSLAGWRRGTSSGVSAAAAASVCKVSDLDAQSRTLLYGARSRGWVELDLLLGGFAERAAASLRGERGDLFAAVLARSNGELLRWISGQAPPPGEMLSNEVFVELLRYVNSEHPALDATATWPPTPERRPRRRRDAEEEYDVASAAFQDAAEAAADEAGGSGATADATTTAGAADDDASLDPGRSAATA